MPETHEESRLVPEESDRIIRDYIRHWEAFNIAMDEPLYGQPNTPPEQRASLFATLFIQMQRHSTGPGANGKGGGTAAAAGLPPTQPAAPPPPNGPTGPTPPAAATPATGGPTCPDHRAPMLPSKLEYGGGYYCPNQAPDGGRCKWRADVGGVTRKAGPVKGERA